MATALLTVLAVGFIGATDGTSAAQSVAPSGAMTTPSAAGQAQPGIVVETSDTPPPTEPVVVKDVSVPTQPPAVKSPPIDPDSDEVDQPSVVAPAPRFWTVAVQGGYRLVFGNQPSQGGSFPSMPLLGAELAMNNLFVPRLSIALDANYGWTAGTLTTPAIANLPFNSNVIDFGIAAQYDFNGPVRFVPFVGIRVGIELYNRNFDSNAYAASVQSYTTAAPALFVGFKYYITPRFAIGARARIGYLPYNRDGSSGVFMGDFQGFLSYAIGVAR